MSHSTELRSKLVQGIEELEADLVKLRSALAALDESAPADDDAAAQRAARRRSRRAPGAVVVPAGKIEALLNGSDGITTAELAKQTDGGHEQILSILKELEDEGKAHRSGTRRSTRWHAGAAHTNGASAAAPAAVSA
jgi:hypothetical protein